MRTRVALLAIGASLMVAGQAWAERVSRSVSDVTAASDRRGGSQVFFRWDSGLPDGVAVRNATLRFDRVAERGGRTLTVRVYPVTAPWAGSGEVVYDRELWSHAEIDLREAGPLVIDVTTVVKEIVEGGLRVHGFVLAADGAEESGLTQTDVSRLGGLSSAMIDVVWRRVPPAPRR